MASESDTENDVGFMNLYTNVNLDGFIVTDTYVKAKPVLDEWECFDEDVWITGCVKSGTTWTQEMVWLIVNDLDYEGAKDTIFARAPQWETSSMVDLRPVAKVKHVDIPLHRADSLRYIKEKKVKGKPMCIKTHLPFNLLPNQIKNGNKKPKIVFTARDPKDTFVSLYHFTQNLFGYKDTIVDLAKIYLEGQSIYGPVWEHTISYWNERHRENLLIITYEEMINNLPAVINKVSTFLGKTFTDEQIKELANHLSFQSMKNNPAVNYKDYFDLFRSLGLNSGSKEFMRSGKVGSHKTELPPELIKQFNQIGKKKAKESGWNFV